MSAVALAIQAQQVGIGLWVLALLFKRDAMVATRAAAAALSAVLLVILPIVVATDAGVSARRLTALLLLALLNAGLAAVWGLVAEVPKGDMASLLVICVFSAVIVLMLVLENSAPLRMF